MFHRFQRFEDHALKMAVEWDSAARRAGQGKLTEAQARAVINSILEHSGQESIVFYKTRDWLNEWISDKRLSSEAGTVEKYAPVVRRFLEHIGGKADAGLGSITPANIRSFRDALHGEGRSANTVNQIISKVLSAPFSKAVRLGYVPLNPCRAVEALKPTRAEAGTFSVAQIGELLDATVLPDWRGLILAGFYTGQRLGDLAALKWSQVDLPNRMMYFKQKKGGAGVAVPIHPDLLVHLQSLRAPVEMHEPVFPSLYGKAESSLLFVAADVIDLSGRKVRRRVFGLPNRVVFLPALTAKMSVEKENALLLPAGRKTLSLQGDLPFPIGLTPWDSLAPIAKRPRATLKRRLESSSAKTGSRSIIRRGKPASNRGSGHERHSHLHKGRQRTRAIHRVL